MATETTTVFPLTLQWVHKFRASVDDDCGPDLILGKFLTSLLNNKFTACNMKPYPLDDRDIEGRVYLSRSEAGTIYESDGDWTTDEETGYSKCKSETPYKELAAFDMTMVTEPHLFDALDIEGSVYLSRGEVRSIYESDGEEWTTDEGHSKCKSETPYNKLVRACDVTAVKEPHLFDALDIAGSVYLSRGEVRSIYESDGEEWTTDEGHSKCESETPYNKLVRACDVTAVKEPYLFDALDIEGSVYLSRGEVRSIYESDGEEWTTDEGHSKCESETPYNKLVTACDVTAVKEPHLFDALDIAGSVYLSRGEVRSIYESDGEEWTTDEGHSKCESETPYNKLVTACDVTAVKEPYLFDALDIEGSVYLSRSEVGTIYESDGEEWTTDEGHSKCESETPYNKLTACDVTAVTEPHLFDALDIEGSVYLSRGEVGSIYESDGEEWTTDEGHRKCESETPYNKLVTACDVTAVKEPCLFGALDIEGSVYLSRSEVETINESDGEEWTTDEGHSKCKSETPYNKLTACDVTAVTEPYLFDALDIEGRVYLSGGEVGTIYESDGEEWTTDKGHRKCESETPYNKLTACDVTAVKEPHMFDALDIEGRVYLSRGEVGSIYESDGEEWTTDEGHSKCESETPYKLTACDVTAVQEPHLFDALDIEGRVYLSRGESEVGTIYESDGEEWTTDEETGHSPDGDITEERLAVLTSTVPDVQSDCATEEGAQILDPFEMDQQSDFATEMIQLLNSFEMDQQSDFATEEMIQPLSPFEMDQQSTYGGEEMILLLDPLEMDQQSDYGAEEMIQLLDPMEPTEHSDSGTEEEFHLLDPVEVPMLHVWQEVALEPEAATTKRLSRYELHYGPTHRVQSPSCPMIGVRGDSRGDSDDVELPSLQNMAPEYHQGEDTAARTTRGPRVKTVTPKTHHRSFLRDPIVNLPSPCCPWWLLLMGLPSFLSATFAVVQNLGKLLEKSPLGQPHLAWSPALLALAEVTLGADQS
ncbi:uncharacterized protein [Branchiostoma lanceolatum]|uniref:uncharacterized protein n=1 Tax=Branchiostoma lanceolatum TaxID=7740 RepID=UPI0034548E7F